MRNYDFGEKKTEYSRKQGGEIPVFISDKYRQSREKAIEIIEKYEDVNEGDFWILMNETKTKKMMYTGLIISHNACLKINDHLPEDARFRPECVTRDKDGYGGSLLYTYCCPEQGIYEVGEVSPSNCKNDYPHAMALKRCMDRVILKACKLAYDGVYSDSEAEEFSYREEPTEESREKAANDVEMFGLNKRISNTHIRGLNQMIDDTESDRDALLKYYKVESIAELTEAQYGDCMNKLARKKADKEERVIGAE